MKKARSECRESFLKTFSEIPKIRGYTDGEPQLKVGGGFRGKGPLKCFIAKHSNSKIFQPTKDGGWLVLVMWSLYNGEVYGITTTTTIQWRN